MTRDMDKKVLPAVKMGNFVSSIFFFYYFAVKPSENTLKNVENRILLSHP